MSSRPPNAPQGGLRIPLGVDRVIAHAASDPAFLSELQQRGSAAAVDAGFSLSDAERRALDSMPAPQLATLVSALRQRAKGADLAAGPAQPVLVRDSHMELSRGTRPIVPIALAASGAVLLGGAAASMLLVTGSRPDEPPLVHRADAPDPDDAGAGDADEDAKEDAGDSSREP